jgi:NDP-sugar pyrophosphorylase family protein
LEIIIKRLIRFGFVEIVINVHHLADLIIDFIKSNNYFNISIEFSDERDRLLDTGGAIWKARAFLGKEPFLVHNVDIISDIDLMSLKEFHLKNKNLATLAVRNRKTSRYLLIDGKGALRGWKNVKTGETLMVKKDIYDYHQYGFSGVYMSDNKIFEHMNPENNIFSVIPVFLQLSKKMKVAGFEHNDGFWYDIGKTEQLQKMQNEAIDLLNY